MPIVPKHGEVRKNLLQLLKLERFLRNPRNSLANPQGSVDHRLNSTAVVCP
jgi:hypothetical protein